MKKAAGGLFGVGVFLFLLVLSCKPKPQEMVIHNFLRYQDSFVTVAEYIESFEWEDNWIGFRVSSENKMRFTHPDGSDDTEMLGIDDDVVDSAEKILIELNYQNLQRTRASKNTIIFEVKDPYFNWDYYNQGICYVIDGGEPTPEVNLDYYTEYIEPLGDNWYYWNGHCYFP